VPEILVFYVDCKQGISNRIRIPIVSTLGANSDHQVRISTQDLLQKVKKKKLELKYHDCPTVTVVFGNGAYQARNWTGTGTGRSLKPPFISIIYRIWLTDDQQPVIPINLLFCGIFPAKISP
jgi:hypothetical protein